MIEFIEKEPWYDRSPLTGSCYRYPNYMVKDGIEFFMFHRRSPQASYEDAADEAHKKHLLSTGGRYFKFNGYEVMNMVPFIDVLSGRGNFITQIVLNIIMTVPFGFLFPLTRKNGAKFSTTVFYCFLLSLGIELIQPLINDWRSSDITDIITNVLGGMIGYGFYKVFKPLVFKILNHIKS